MNQLSPREALNKGYLRMQIDHEKYNRFLDAINILIDNIKGNTQREEEQKNIMTQFLLTAFYNNHNICAVDDIDVAIRMDCSSSSNIGVMIETKGIGKPDMPTTDNLNTKAIHELILYYLRQRKAGNTDIRHLIVTNTKEFFIFDAKEFERLFYRNAKLIKQFNDFEAGNTPDTSTTFFYNEIAKPAVKQIHEEIKFTYFSLEDYANAIRRRETSGKLTLIYRLLSPVHLLKLPFQNDSNLLNEKFYKELLHLIGLGEYRDGNKFLIQRNKTEHRNRASLLENTINILTVDSIRLPRVYGQTYEERLINVAMELCIVWINRILFLKLLEAQLINYHRRDKEFRFLTYNKIPDFDGLNRLFFQVMAVAPDRRTDIVKELFPDVPYLNSSLFEPTELERICFRISSLEQSVMMPIMPRSVLLNDDHFANKTALPFLEYLFAFLDAYNFSSEGTGEVAQKPKTLINASVLGLIFEKINGYKDGAVFTPGYITKYMCEQALRQAVVKKFNDYYGWNLTDFAELLNADYDLHVANDLINSLTICDPAVGSGHFLVSALNELILIKFHLGCLFDRSGRRIKPTEYEIEVDNDELIIMDSDHELWSYNPNFTESRRLQETIFNEKRTIIENCLFGVDINPNSVNICRLRLWIELLKNAYYTAESGYANLETLPNIDINIKCGNSLIQKFKLNDLIVNQDIRRYRKAVEKYKGTHSKETKADVEELIENIKGSLVTEIYDRSPLMLRLKHATAHYERFNYARFDEFLTKKERKLNEKNTEKAKQELIAAQKAVEEAKSSKIYQGSFEWRMEFPEVLDDQGNFIGFDVIIGNPPYGYIFKDINYRNQIMKDYSVAEYKIEAFAIFIEKAYTLLRVGGLLSLITPYTFVSGIYFSKLRTFLKDVGIDTFILLGKKIFVNMEVDTSIITLTKDSPNRIVRFCDLRLSESTHNLNSRSLMNIDSNIFFAKYKEVLLTASKEEINLYVKLYKSTNQILENVVEFYHGVQTRGNNQALTSEIVSSNSLPIIKGADFNRYKYPRSSYYITFTKENIKSGGDISYYNVDKKIVVRTTADKIIASIDYERCIALNSVNVAIPRNGNDVEMEILVGLLNSKLMEFWYRMTVQETAKTFAEVKIVYLNRMPIVSFNDHERKAIISLVKKSFESNGEHRNSVIRLLDILIFKLYGLSYDEVLIADSETDISKDEYESFCLNSCMEQ